MDEIQEHIFPAESLENRGIVFTTTGVQLIDQEVRIGIAKFGEDFVYHNATWIGDPGTEREAQILVGPGDGSVQLIAGNTYRVRGQVVDNIEEPVQEVGLWHVI